MAAELYHYQAFPCFSNPEKKLMSSNKLLEVGYLLINASTERAGLESLSCDEVKFIANNGLSNEEAQLILDTCLAVHKMQLDGQPLDENDWFYFFEKPLTIGLDAS
ncbi:hypothetical protein ACVSUB_05065 [Yersinia enterocolitica]